MPLYAERPIRRTVQLGTDVVAAVVLVFAIWLAFQVHDEILRLQAPGNGLVSAGDGLRGTFDDAAGEAGHVPLIGDALAKALHGGSSVGNQLAEAGRWQIDAVGDLAGWLAVLIVAVPVLALAVTWLPLRWRFVRGATAARRLRERGDDGLDVLALRALATQPLRHLASDTASGWRDGDRKVIGSLARRELARYGLDA